MADTLEEEKRSLTVLHNIKVGGLLSLACERAFVSPSVLDHGKHMGDWQKLMLDTAKELSDLSQKIALSTTSAELVEQELKRCRKKERETRWEEVRGGGRVFHSTPFQARPVVGPPEADDVNGMLVWSLVCYRTSAWCLMTRAFRRRSMLRRCKLPKRGPTRVCLGQREHVSPSVLESRVVRTCGPKHDCFFAHMHVKNVFVCVEVWP